MEFLRGFFHFTSTHTLKTREKITLNIFILHYSSEAFKGEEMAELTLFVSTLILQLHEPCICINTYRVLQSVGSGAAWITSLSTDKEERG